jgi:hypothetical protein
LLSIYGGCFVNGRQLLSRTWQGGKTKLTDRDLPKKNPEQIESIPNR